MKKLLIGIMAMAIVSGCASTTTTTAPTVTAATVDDFVTQNEAIIAAAVKVVKNLTINQVITDPVKQAQIQADIAACANAVNGLLVTGTFDPSQVTLALKANDPAINNYLSVVPIAYAAIYQNSNADQKLAHDILVAIAGGLQ